LVKTISTGLIKKIKRKNRKIKTSKNTIEIIKQQLKNTMKNRISIYLFLTIILSSCDKENIEYYSFPEKIWHSQEKVKFNINIEDTTRLYSLDFSIRHTTF